MYASKFQQQDDYNNKRFFRFIFRRAQLIDKRVAPALLAAAGIGMFWNYAWILSCAILLIGAAAEKNPLTQSKKKLVKTHRQQRIFYGALFMAAALLWATPNLWTLPILVVALPFLLMISNAFWRPIERVAHHYKYIRPAQKKLNRINPITIGITGSFGKTSVKNIIGHVLSATDSAYATPKSINTIMGVVRVINMELSPSHKYFIVEMGTDRPGGSLGKLCELIRPRYGILTAIGDAHLENYKDLDELAAEKAKLLKAAGSIVINGVQVAEKYIAKYASGNDDVLRADMLSDIRIESDGLHFNFDGHKIFAPVFSTVQAYNIALAFMTLRKIGVPASNIILALRTLPQTPHRLEVLRRGDITIIDDGYNSNLDGFLSALNAARILADKSGGRAIIITPGIVELGPKHAEYHKTVGRAANELMDVVVAVAFDRIKDFTDEIALQKRILVLTKRDADNWLAENARPGDVVLYENDLPDFFEETIRI
jgi:UDP-N-acetylmuramoyl-tripeptide--D-alanyl-D-alanine ligase